MKHFPKTAHYGALAATIFLGSGAFAHHGWNWAEEEQSRLTGTIQSIYIGPPHPRLQVETQDGVWTVDLGNPQRTRNAGFIEGATREGAEITILGNRSSDSGEKLMKAVRATIDGKHYDFYPERITQE